MKFIYHGKLKRWVGGKDLILHTIGDIGVDGALYMAMEFEGEAITNLPMYGRLTMCNMAIEAGGKNGIIVPDRITKKYVKEGRARREFIFYKSVVKIKIYRDKGIRLFKDTIDSGMPSSSFKHKTGCRTFPCHHKPGSNRLMH